MSPLCHCGHEKSEHYEGKHNCWRQCDCKAFASIDRPKPKPPQPWSPPGPWAPMVDNPWADLPDPFLDYPDDPPDTLPMIPVAPKVRP